VNLRNTESQADSDIARAKLDVEFAELALRKYIEGEYPQQLKSARADVEIARETYKRESDRAEWSNKLLAKGFITESEADADAAAANKAKLDLEIAEGELRLLKEFTYKQKKRELESDVEQAKAELERVVNKAEADKEKAKVEFRTAESKLARAEREMEDIEKDIANCEITAPVAGRIVYAPQGNRWRQEEPVGVGDEVRMGQELIHLPNPKTMGVAIKIEEANRGKVEVGMPVAITGANLPEAGLRGRLAKIATYLDPSGWWNNDQKVYSAEVAIESDAPVRTGMNAKTRIIVAKLEDVLVVPVQSVVMQGGRRVVYVADGKGGFTPRPVRVGQDDGTLIEVVEGLEAGEVVSQTPPLDAPDVEEQANAEDEKLADLVDDDAGEAGDAAAGERGAGDAAAGDSTDPAEASDAGDGGDGEGGRADDAASAKGPTAEQRQRAMMLKQLRDGGRLDEVDDDVLVIVNRYIDKTEAGEAYEFSAEERRKLAEAMKAAFGQRGGGGGSESESGGGGRS